MLHRPVKRRAIAFRKRRFKRTSLRKLSVRDLSVLDFLWTWKVASTPMLGEVAFKGKSKWWTYKALRQLQSERYIQLLPRGTNLEQELWALTDVDGITQFQGGLTRGYVGYEVDLNLKDNERYEATFKYYQPLSDLYFIVWLVRTEWMANRICEMYKESTNIKA